MDTSPSEKCMSCFKAEAKLQCRHCKDFFICSRACAESNGVEQELHMNGDCVLAEPIGDDYSYQINQWLYQSQHAATEAERTRAAQWVKYYVGREKATGGRYGHYRPPGWDPNFRYGDMSKYETVGERARALYGVPGREHEFAQWRESANRKASEARRLQMERGLAMEIGEDEEEFIDRSYATEIAYYQRILDDPRSTPSAKAHARRRIALFYAKQGGG